MTGNRLANGLSLLALILIFTLPAIASSPTLHGLVPDPVDLEEVLAQVQARGEKAHTFAPEPFVTPAADDPPQTWTFLFYDDADFSYAYDPWDDFRIYAHASDNVQILVLRDTNSGTARLYQLVGWSSYMQLDDWGERDMGDPATVADLLIYAKTNFPADRYAMAVYDHGGGWSGSCFDVTNGGWLTMDDMAAGLTAGGGLDLLMFTAPCLMGSVEAVYELRDVVDVYIGSEELSGYIDWREVMDPFCTLLNDSAALTTEEVAAQTLDMIVDLALPEYLESVAMGATKASATGALIDALDDFAYYRLFHLAALKTEVATALEATTRFGEYFDYDRAEVDIGDFTDQALARINDPVARELLTAIRTALDEAVVAAVHGSALPRAQGLSVFFPETEAQANEDYPNEALDITESTYWDEYVFWRLTDEPPSGVADEVDLKLVVSCGPNPAPWTSQIRFSLPVQKRATLRVFDVAGRLVRTVCDDVMAEGPHTLIWNGKNDAGREQASGVYLMLLESGGKQATAKAMLVR